MRFFSAMMMLCALALFALSVYQLVVDAECQHPDGSWQRCQKKLDD